LIVELDGSQHLEQVVYDDARTRWLETQGYRVVRFWNGDALTSADAVATEILRIAETRRPAKSRPV
jgi:adenine-specific DNA-methyltransferase